MTTIHRPRNRSWRQTLLAGVGLLLVAASTVAATGTLDPDMFPVDDRLRPNVDFWTTIYSGLDNDRVLLHDERYLQVVYEALDLSDLTDLPDTRRRLLRRQRIRDAESKYGALLGDLAAGRRNEALADEYVRLEALFAGVPGDRGKYRAAIGRLRTQTCLRNRFAEGIVRSGAVLPAIESIFTARGLPVALSRLPFVESLFQTHAHSSASAVGTWQFVRPTARRFLRMDLELDERYDPLHAAEAAASLLTENHRSLGTWPLAITAYNHGAAGMRRAVRNTGSRNLGVIVDSYRSRTFGFASRNFYSEFIAATTVYDQRASRFAGLEPAPPLRFETFVPDRYVHLPALATAADADLAQLRTLNPALNREVWSGDLLFPKDYQLRVLPEHAEAVRTAYASLPAERTSAHQQGRWYRVRGGDTLGQIAGTFGTTVGALQRANNLGRSHLIRIGQKLLIPPGRGASAGRSTAATTAPAAPLAGEATAHIVRPGDTLSSIARRYGTTVAALRAGNGLANADLIAVGQRLTLTAAGRGTHVVRRGDTLAAIARRYGTSIQALRHHNRLRGDVIHPSQVLVIP